MDSESGWDNCSVSAISISPSYYNKFSNLDDSDWDNCSIFSRPLPSPYYEYDVKDEYDYPPSLMSWSSFIYEFLNGDIPSRCTHCDWPPPPRDTLLAAHFDREHIFRDPKFEQENYRDLRSAARSQRPRKRQDRRMCHSYKCRKQGQAYADNLNTKNKREIRRFANLDRLDESMNT